MRYLGNLIVVIILSLSGCTTATIISQTPTSAVIQGQGATVADAKANAVKEATKMFGSVKEVKKPECSEMEIDTRGTGPGAGGVHYVQKCIMYFEKK